VAHFVRGPPWDREGRGRWTICLTAVVFVLAFFLRFNAEFYQAQARYFFPVLVPIAALLSAGWHHLALWAPPARRSQVERGLTAALVLFAVTLAIAGLAVNWPGAVLLPSPLS
jgi:hypothetical protein